MNSPYSFVPAVFSIAAFIAVPFQSAQALSSPEVSAIAEAITVRIEGQNPGSGVIIKRQGKVYTVLTAAHVVATADEYDLITTDDQQHPLNYSQVKKLPDVDLALVEFTSSKDYKVAELGDSTVVKAGESIYVSGFPMPTAAITESIWSFSDGKVKANAKRPLADGYALVYSNDTLPGMSGGAVLDSQGKLVGIHGRADAEQQVQRTETVHVKTGFNLGIPINTFLRLVATVNPNLGFVAKGAASTNSALTADDWFLQATDQYQKGDYQGAIAKYDQAIALDPELASAYLDRGVNYSELQEYAKAIADFDKAISLDPQNAIAYYNRGNISQALQKYPEAIVDFDQAIALDPEFADAYNNRGTSYAQSKQYPQAIADYDKTLTLNPEHAIAYHGRGLVNAITGNIPQAKQDLQTAARLFRQQNNLAKYERVIQFLQKL